ncbi:hypothetical protein JG688_00000992 [Phytophthora aleatoria]|uniref:Secreted protein n=1 Tax=Phytophthora aleatoria TaxID=2496075 RepID=A0A8J5J516_9STRA|nr:hypothetical protein JG688_00000992 [Phytophthora aleatoria]
MTQVSIVPAFLLLLHTLHPMRLPYRTSKATVTTLSVIRARISITLEWREILWRIPMQVWRMKVWKITIAWKWRWRVTLQEQ